MDVMSKVVFKTEKNNDKSNQQEIIKMDVVNEINQMRRFLQKLITMKKSAIAVVQEHMC